MVFRDEDGDREEGFPERRRARLSGWLDDGAEFDPPSGLAARTIAGLRPLTGGSERAASDAIERAMRIEEGVRVAGRAPDAEDSGFLASRLRRALRLMLDDGTEESLAPPAGLAFRTMRRVAKVRASERTSSRAAREFESPLTFRMRDTLAAAALVAAAVLTAFPSIARLREEQRLIECRNNLRTVGSSMLVYRDATEGRWPVGGVGIGNADPFRGPEETLRAMREMGLIGDDDATLACPTAFHDQTRRRSPREGARTGTGGVAGDDSQTKTMWERLLASDYGFGIASRVASVQNRGLQGLARGERPIPLIADRPPIRESELLASRNSPNHFGLGQNVFFGDGSARWTRTRAVSASDRDLFLNQDRRQSPGVHGFDSVLVPGGFEPNSLEVF